MVTGRGHCSFNAIALFLVPEALVFWIAKTGAPAETLLEAHIKLVGRALALTSGADRFLSRIGQWETAVAEAANLSSHSHACRHLTFPSHIRNFGRTIGEYCPQDL